MKTKGWLSAASLVALLALAIGRAPLATEPAIRELRIHGPSPAPNQAVAASVAQGSGYLYATGAAGAGGTAAASPAWAGGDCAAEPPPPAKAAGLTKLAFCDDFSSSATIDLDGTLNDGFKWYITGLPFGYQGTRKEGYVVRDGTLTVYPDLNQAQLSFLSAVVPPGAGRPVGWYIDRQTQGWYAEARIAHEAKAVEGGFPAFWTMDMCHLYRYPRPCARFVEPDFYEFIHGGDIRAVHLYQNPTGQQPEKLDMWLSYHPSESRDVNWLDFNTVALRALPDSVNHFVNGRQVSHSSLGARTWNGTFFWLNEVVAGPPLPWRRRRPLSDHLRIRPRHAVQVGLGQGVGEAGSRPAAAVEGRAETASPVVTAAKHGAARFFSTADGFRSGAASFFSPIVAQLTCNPGSEAIQAGVGQRRRGEPLPFLLSAAECFISWEKVADFVGVSSGCSNTV